METRWFALVLALALVGNVAYAAVLPDLLEEVRPGMPYGRRQGESPTTEAGTTFVSIGEQAGIDARRLRWEGGDLPYPAVVTGGLAAGDVNDDGWIDLYFPPGGPDHPSHLYLNLGDGTFRDVTDAAGLHATGAFGAGATFGDYDNDGDEDLYALYGPEGHLFENRLDETGPTGEHEMPQNGTLFRPVTEQAGLVFDDTCIGGLCHPTHATWTDYDRDGDLDLYVVMSLDWRDPELHTSGQDYSSLVTFAKAQRSRMYRNDGNGSFTDVTHETKTSDPGKTLSVTTGDVNVDGWPDIFTANDVTQNALFRNRQDGTFVDVAPDLGVNERKTSMGIAARDLTGDGRPEIAISNFRGQGLSLFVQEADGTYRYASRERGLGASTRGTGWGLAAFDYDLDGWLDLGMAIGRAVPLKPHETDIQNIVFPELKRNAQDQLYRNMGEGRFAEATETAGAFGDLNNTRGLLPVDVDNDGDLDVVRTTLQGRPAEVLRNDLDDVHGSLQLDLEGRASNRDGYGARVVVELPTGRTLTRWLVSSGSYQTGLSPRLTVGLGANHEARVTVHWPSGTVQDLGVLPSGHHDVVEPRAS